jgi:hypothetical protein
MSKDSDTLSAEIFKLDITRSEEVLQMVVDLIFDRAVVDHEHTERYVDLCKKIHTRFRSSSKDNKGKHYIIFYEKKRREEKRRSPIPNSFYNFLRVFFHSHILF